MNKTLVILKHEFLKTVKRRGFVIMTLAIPLLALLAIFGFQAFQGNGEETPVTQTVAVGYVDEVGIFNDYQLQGNVLLIGYDNPETAFNSMLDDDTSQYFIIPSDYLSTGVVNRYTLSRELEPPSEVWHAIGDFLVANLLAGESDKQLVERVQYPLSMSSTTLDTTGQVAEDQGGYGAFIVPYIFSILLVMAIFTSSGYLLQGLGEEKENRIMEVLLSSVSPRQLITGKVLGLGAAGLIQILIWLISARFIAGMASSTIGGILSSLQVPTDFLVISLIYFILGYFLFAIIMAGAGAIGANAREGQQYSLLFIWAAVVPFFFISSIMENPDGTIAQVLTFFPFTAPITAIIRMGMTDIPLWQMAISAGLMLLTILGMLWLVAKIFRTFLLMYGKTPKLGEVVRYLRQA